MRTVPTTSEGQTMKQQFFSPHDCMTLLGVRTTAFYEKISRGLLPPMRVVGGKKGYTRRQLEEILGYKFDEEAA